MDEVEPAYAGPFGKAWKFPMPAEHDDWRVRTTLDANYLVFAPAAHPFWSWHILMAVHLRDVPGQDGPAVKQAPDMTHELMVFALDPGHPPPDPREWPMPPDPNAPRPLKLMQPPDTVVQFGGVNDEQATEIVAKAAEACTHGILVPDSDHHEAWISSIRATADHYERGLH